MTKFSCSSNKLRFIGVAIFKAMIMLAASIFPTESLLASASEDELGYEYGQDTEETDGNRGTLYATPPNYKKFYRKNKRSKSGQDFSIGKRAQKRVKKEAPELDLCTKEVSDFVIKLLYRRDSDGQIRLESGSNAEISRQFPGKDKEAKKVISKGIKHAKEIYKKRLEEREQQKAANDDKEWKFD